MNPSVLIFWIIMGFAFLKCVEMVLRPFTRRNEEPEEYYEEQQPSIHIHIQDSFNYHSSDSYYKGGTTYHGVSKEKESPNEYYELYKQSIEGNKHYTRGERD